MAADLRTITEIRSRTGSALRTVFLDGERWRDIALPVLRELHVAVGDEIDPEELNTRARELEPAAARARVYRLLAYRDRSSAEVMQRLSEDGYPADVAEELVGDLVSSGLVDDARYAENLGRTLVSLRGFGRQRALREMERKGVSAEHAADVLNEFAPSDGEPERAADAAARLVRSGDSPARLAARLARRGFRPADALHAAEAALRMRDQNADEPG